MYISVYVWVVCAVCVYGWFMFMGFVVLCVGWWCGHVNDMGVGVYGRCVYVGVGVCMCMRGVCMCVCVCVWVGVCVGVYGGCCGWFGPMGICVVLVV